MATSGWPPVRWSASPPLCLILFGKPLSLMCAVWLSLAGRLRLPGFGSASALAVCVCFWLKSITGKVRKKDHLMTELRVCVRSLAIEAGQALHRGVANVSIRNVAPLVTAIWVRLKTESARLVAASGRALSLCTPTWRPCLVEVQACIATFPELMDNHLKVLGHVPAPCGSSTTGSMHSMY